MVGWMTKKIHNYHFGQWPEMPWKKGKNMGKEILAIPEEHLSYVVRVIRDGLDHLISDHQISYFDEAYIQLTNWCDEMEKEEDNE